MNSLHYDVFISLCSKDYAAAQPLFDYLIAKDLKVFKADVSLGCVDHADTRWRKQIKLALAAANNFILFVTDMAYYNRPEIEFEYDIFAHELVRGRKGNMFQIVPDGVGEEQIPDIHLRTLSFFYQSGDNALLLPYCKGSAKTKALESYTPKESKSKHITNLPPDPGLFILRHNTLRDLRNKLYDGKTVAIVNGMGGIGKTTLAQQYCKNYGYSYNYVGYFSGGNSIIDTLLSPTTYTGVADDAYMNKMVQTMAAMLERGAEKHDVFEKFITDMHQAPVSLGLLVVDDVKDLEHNSYALERLSQLNKNWHLLITSRENTPHENCEQFNLSLFNADEAQQVFTLYYTGKTIDELEEHQIDLGYFYPKQENWQTLLPQIVEKLGYHTLAIEFTAKVAKESISTKGRKGWALEEILEKVEQNPINIPTDGAGHFKVKHSKELLQLNQSVVEYFIKCFGRNTLTADEWICMFVMAHLPNRPVNITYIHQLMPVAEITIPQLGVLLKALAEKGWLTETEDEEGYACYYTHAIQAESILAQIGEEDEGIKYTLVGSMIEFIKVKGFEKYQVKIEHVIIGIQYLNKAIYLDKNIKARLYNFIGIEGDKLAQYDLAFEYFNESLSICLDIYGPEHKNTAVRYNNIAGVLTQQKKFTDALEYRLKDLVICKKEYGENALETASCYNGLGVCYRAMGDNTTALEYHQKALKIRIDKLGLGHIDTINSYNNIGSLHLYLEDFDKALEIFNIVLENLDIAFVGDDTFKGLCYYNIANLHTEKSLRISSSEKINFHLNEALRLLELSWRIFEKTIPPGHPYRLSSLNGLAFTYDALHNAELSRLYSNMYIAEKQAAGQSGYGE